MKKFLNKRTLTLAYLSAMTTFPMFADVKSAFNDAMSNYGVYIVGGYILFSAVVGLASNFEAIVDKDENGTRKKGLTNAAWVMVAVMVTIAIIGVVGSVIGTLKVSLS